MKELKNSITFCGEQCDIKFMLDAIKDGDNPFSFEKVIPMPGFLPLYGVNFDKEHQYKHDVWKEDTYNGILCGWGTWRKSNWGCTRDNTKDTCFLTKDGIEFVTQSAPLPVIKALSMLFPKIRFRYKCYHDNGNILVESVYQDGKVLGKTNSEYIEKDAVLRILCEDCENHSVCEDDCALAKKVINDDGCYDVAKIVRCWACIRRENCGNPRKVDSAYYCEYGIKE